MTISRSPNLLLMAVFVGQILWPSASLVAQTTGQPVSQLDLRRPDAVNNLNSHLARLAANPRDVQALIGAGEAALALEDARAATGFFARADEIESGNGRIKAGLGRAMLDMQNPGEALRLFDQATRLGYPDSSFLGARALARDLTGDQAGAQRDYQAALSGGADDSELIRRYAVSLGISGQVDAAEKVIQPLLYKGDRGAWRDRAFIMAMNGRHDQARDIAIKTMPRQLADAIQPYMDRMQSLTPAQRAAAVHFGNFPSDTGVRVAAAPPQSRATEPAAPSLPAASARSRPDAPAPTPNPVKPLILATADAKPKPMLTDREPVASAPNDGGVRRGDRVNARVGRKIADIPPTARPDTGKPAATTPAPVQQAAVVVPVQTPPAAQPDIASSASVAQPVPQVQGPPAPQSPVNAPPASVASDPPAPQSTVAMPQAGEPSPAPAPAPDPQATRTLADIIRELQVPDAERLPSAGAVDLAELDAIQAQKRKARETAAEKAKREAVARARAEADARAKAAAAEKARLAKNPARAWVQVGTGRDVAALAFTMKALRRKYDSLASRDAWTASWGRTNRLVVGPFSSFSKARDYEAQLKKAGADVFAWQSDSGEEVERLTK